MTAPTPDYVSAARGCFDLAGFERVLAKARANGHLTDELHARLEPIGERLAARPPHRDSRPRCTACGHVHTGPELGGVCLDCDCPHRGGAR